jgi:cysteinyl-tRNA synthetase
MMTLRLYNTLTRKKEEFTPLDPQNVRMYVCGPTVYDFAHIGNARPVIVFDVLFRLLRHLYGKDHVTYVRNITDVDDKINARALRDFPDLPLNEAIRRVTEKTANQFEADVKALGNLPPTHEPRATDHIPGMVEMIGVLIKKGHAYQAGGEVLFDVASMKDYGQLSHRKLEEQQAGARVAVEAHKKNPADFVLWKLSSAEEPGWNSPWGHGRPGWHIECSEMSRKYLGEVFDIHGGGLDLIFPHHENEIAQSRCAHGTPVMANIWMHNGFLQIEGKKMSKSDGNFFTIHELLSKWPGDVLRFQMLQSHYQGPIDWTESRCFLASQELEDWSYELIGYWNMPTDDVELDKDFAAALHDDLNTPEAITALRSLYTKSVSGGLPDKLVFAKACKFIGFRNLDMPGYFDTDVTGENVTPSVLNQAHETVVKLRAASANAASQSVFSEVTSFFDGKNFTYKTGDHGFITIVGKEDEFTKEVELLIADRIKARAAKDWKESDRIRDELAAMGITIKDNKDGTTSWEVKR